MRARVNTSSFPNRKDNFPYRFVLRSNSHETWAIILCAAAVFLTVCLLSYDMRDPSFNVATTRAQVSNLGGLVGSYLADALVRLLGFAAFLVPLSLVFVALRLFLPRGIPLRWSDPLYVLMLVLGFSVLLDRFSWNPAPQWALSHPGGVLGAFFHAVCFRLFGRVGEVLLVLTLMLLNMLYLARVSPRNCLRVAKNYGSRGVGWLRGRLQQIRDAARSRKVSAENKTLQPVSSFATVPPVTNFSPVNSPRQDVITPQRDESHRGLEEPRIPWSRVQLVQPLARSEERRPEVGSPDPQKTASQEPGRRVIPIRPLYQAVPQEPELSREDEEEFVDIPEDLDEYELGEEEPDAAAIPDEFDFEPPFVDHSPTESADLPMASCSQKELVQEPAIDCSEGEASDASPFGEDAREIDQPPIDHMSPGEKTTVREAPAEGSEKGDEEKKSDVSSGSELEGAGNTVPEPVSSQALYKPDTIPPDHERLLEEAIEEYLREELQEKAETFRAKTSQGDVHTENKPAPLHVVTVAKRADETPAHQASIAGIRGWHETDDFVLPPSTLLDPPSTETRSVDVDLLERNAGILEQKLADLGIRAQVVEIHPGPVITMYEVMLAPGVPLRRVLNTSDDLAMALKSGSTRIVAPIPGKDTVGIEVPNLHREIVHFREIVESSAFTELKAPLKMALGKCTDGRPFATSLAKMPHLLIAGATGTGKSVGLNCIICSWLMSCHPDDVKLIMVDPKKLELSYYQDIPHLIHPVVTDPDKVPRVLSWAIREMERRYELLSKVGARNIEGYNRKTAAARAENPSDTALPEKLPYLVIIVDELAELMMVAAKDIETSIARLAQMARAAGIHLILATQRPSVDVITGVIKANFPARISFQVSARPDSRTILDATGAENLLGMGDMLFLPPGTSKMVRLHGSFVTESEITRITDFIRAQRTPNYLKEIETHVAEADGKGAVADAMEDPKYDEAVELVTRLGHASISLIQRHMRIGYNRAARIIECMEAEGIIGPSDGTSRPREVLVRSLHSIPDGP